MERPTAFTLGKKTQWQRVTFEKNTWYIELLCSTKDDAVGLPLNPESDGSLPAPVGQNINLLYLSGLVPTAENVEENCLSDNSANVQFVLLGFGLISNRNTDGIGWGVIKYLFKCL